MSLNSYNNNGNEFGNILNNPIDDAINITKKNLVCIFDQLEVSMNGIDRDEYDIFLMNLCKSTNLDTNRKY
jgi:Tfp pilus assembly ATPase PilU